MTYVDELDEFSDDIPCPVCGQDECVCDESDFYDDDFYDDGENDEPIDMDSGD